MKDKKWDKIRKYFVILLIIILIFLVYIICTASTNYKNDIEQMIPNGSIIFFNFDKNIYEIAI